INGQPLTLIGYHGLVTGLATVELDIRRAHEKGETVIVFAHTGAEYTLRFTARQQRDYRRLIDAGADLVIGSHPHVVEPLEIYRGKLIAYSLGNFIFDQYFSTDTQQHLMVQLQATDRQFTFRLTPLISVRSQVRLAPASIGQRLLDRLARDSVATSAQRQTIRSGTITLSR
ncbi:MAG: CapA family protein, partial [Candidatus Kerfeldbacteria bacterium]|nr:CapA family protein [Candidatus Kerfeldbacteria bacterium]